jgi:hypothetical protein
MYFGRILYLIKKENNKTELVAEWKKASVQQCITAITADSTTSESTRNC